MAFSLITAPPLLANLTSQRQKEWRDQCAQTGVAAAALVPTITTWRSFETYAAVLSNSGSTDNLDLTALSTHQACVAAFMVTLQSTGTPGNLWHRHLTACWKRDTGNIAVVGTPVVIANADPGGLAADTATITVATDGTDQGRIQVVAGSTIHPLIATIEVMFGTVPYDLAP